MDNFIRKTDLATVEAQRCCASQLHFTIKWESKKITNEFILLFVILSCRVGWRRSTLRLYIHFLLPIVNRELLCVTKTHSVYSPDKSV